MGSVSCDLRAHDKRDASPEAADFPVSCLSKDDNCHGQVFLVTKYTGCPQKRFLGSASLNCLNFKHFQNLRNIFNHFTQSKKRSEARKTKEILPV